MFIKLPSGRIFRIESITSCKWLEPEHVLSVSCFGDETDWHLKDEDAKRLYEYLESIAIIVAIGRFLWLNSFISVEMYIEKFLSLGVDAIRKSGDYDWSFKIFRY